MPDKVIFGDNPDKDDICWKHILKEKPWTHCKYYVMLSDGTIDTDTWVGEEFHFYGKDVIKWRYL